MSFKSGETLLELGWPQLVRVVCLITSVMTLHYYVSS